MVDLSWLSHEAKSIHDLFTSWFYAFAVVLLLLGIVIEYFKIPLGGTPAFSQLVGRVFVAAILLHSYPEVSNTIASVMDALAHRLGDFNQIKTVLSRMGDKLCELKFNWMGVKNVIILALSFLSFFLLYVSVYIADAVIAYAWVLLYVFSPLLIALFILPSTAGATAVLYRTLFEIGAWKIVWSVLATLVWSSAMSGVNSPTTGLNFLSAISLNLLLAASMLLTPFIVNALAGAGFGSVMGSVSGITTGSRAFNPGRNVANAGQFALRASANGIRASYSHGASAFKKAFSPLKKEGPKKSFRRKEEG